MNWFKHFSNLKEVHSPVNIYMANDFGVWKPYRLYESDIRQYCMILDQGGITNFVVAAGHKGFSRFISESFESSKGDRIVSIIDLNNGENVTFEWVLEIPIPL